MLLRFLTLSTILGMAAAMPAQASPIIYEPTNPVFQPGNQLSGPTLIAVAEAQKKQKPADTSSSFATSAGRTAQAALVSRITSDLYNKIFQCGGTGPACAPTGSYDFGDGSSISYVRGGGSVEITFVDPTNGSTVINIPTT